MYAISVVLTTYNQPLNKIFQTLNSIVSQDFDSFEIVVADDASQENPREAIERYFAEAGFSDFQIVVHEKNLGTVRNNAEGAALARGKYVKAIGAGDLLFAPDTLRKIYEFCLAREVDLAFGRVMAFTDSDDEPCAYSFDAPTKPEMYSGVQDHEAIVAQQLIRSDWVPGGGLFYRRDYLLDYLFELADAYQVRYCEDLVSVLVAFTDDILYFDEYILWYEWGFGVSNDGSKASKRKAYSDHTNFFNELKRRYPNSKTIKRANLVFRVKRFVMIKTPIAEFLRRFKASQYLSKPKEQTQEISAALEFLSNSKR